jgi:pectate lyase
VIIRRTFGVIALAWIGACSDKSASESQPIPEQTGGSATNSGGAGTGGMGAMHTTTGGVSSPMATGGTLATGGLPPSSGGVMAMSGGSSEVGGGTAMTTGGSAPSSGGSPANTGGAPASGGSPASSGGSSPSGPLVAFPGAEGFGRFAIGARGGDVYHVTNLNDSGAGSFRDAISKPNRTVVFEVSGVIEVGERLIFEENLTIAGQTAPGGGITLYGNGTSFTNSNHTIVRYLRFRMGKIGDSGKDTITIARGHDLIFDHCSISWGRDGNFDLNQESGYELSNITLSDSIVAQGLQTHSTGGLVNAAGVSVLRSLWIDNNSRNPKARQTTQWVNNVTYNWVASGYILGDTSGRSDGYLVGNCFIPGPETDGGTLDSPSSAYHVFADGNFYDSDKDGTLGGRVLGQGDFGSVTWETAPSVDFPKVTEMTAAEAFAHVSAKAGASKWRDEADDYVVAELASLGKQGKTISDEASLGLANAVGEVPSGTAPKDEDRDGMADAWEAEHGLDPSDAADRNADRNGDGWTNLEEYVNSLAPSN